MPEDKLKFKDDEGNIGQGQTLTDLAVNNKAISELIIKIEESHVRQDRHTKVLKIGIGIGAVAFLFASTYLVYMTFYIIKFNVLNNIVAAWAR